MCEANLLTPSPRGSTPHSGAATQAFPLPQTAPNSTRNSRSRSKGTPACSGITPAVPGSPPATDSTDPVGENHDAANADPVNRPVATKRMLLLQGQPTQGHVVTATEVFRPVGAAMLRSSSLSRRSSDPNPVKKMKRSLSEPSGEHRRSSMDGWLFVHPSQLGGTRKKSKKKGEHEKEPWR